MAKACVFVVPVCAMADTFSMAHAAKLMMGNPSHKLRFLRFAVLPSISLVGARLLAMGKLAECPPTPRRQKAAIG